MINLTHLVAGKNVAIDLSHHRKETKEAVEAVEGRLLVNLPGVELQNVKICSKSLGKAPIQLVL